MKQPIYNTALYLRLSRDDENAGESNSISTQRMMLRRYAEQNGLFVVDEYIDDGYSGTNFDRPDFQRMIDERPLPAGPQLPFDRAIYGTVFPGSWCTLYRHR